MPAGTLRGRPKSRALRPCARQAGMDAFANAFPLELGERGEDVELQLAGRCRRVDAFI